MIQNVSTEGGMGFLSTESGRVHIYEQGDEKSKLDALGRARKDEAEKMQRFPGGVPLHKSGPLPGTNKR